MRDQIRGSPAQRVHQIYRDVLVNAAAVAAAQNQEPVNLRYDSIRSQVNRARNVLLPRIPRAVKQGDYPRYLGSNLDRLVYFI